MLRRLAITWVFNIVALLVATWLLSGLSFGGDRWALLVAALVFTLVNVYIRPVLAVLSIPLIVATLGGFYVLINVFMLYLTHWVVPRFSIAGFWWALLAALIVSVVNGVLALAFSKPGRTGARVGVWLWRRRRQRRRYT
jgi:putative membrane protein